MVINEESFTLCSYVGTFPFRIALFHDYKMLCVIDSHKLTSMKEALI